MARTETITRMLKKVRQVFVTPELVHNRFDMGHHMTCEITLKVRCYKGMEKRVAQALKDLIDRELKKG